MMRRLTLKDWLLETVSRVALLRGEWEALVDDRLAYMRAYVRLHVRRHLDR